MRKNKILPLLLVAAMTTTALTACSSTSGSNVENSKKPLVWFNRQPSNSSTGELDMDALKFNDKTSTLALMPIRVQSFRDRWYLITSRLMQQPSTVTVTA